MGTGAQARSPQGLTSPIRGAAARGRKALAGARLVVLAAALGAGAAAGDPAAGVAYGVDSVHQRLYALDLRTGAARALGRLRHENVRDLAADPATGLLYGIDTVTDTLVRIDPRTGAEDSLGRLSGVGDAFVGSVDFDPVSGALHALDYNTRTLYRVDLATGRLHRVARLDDAAGRTGAIAFARDGRLFVTDTRRDRLAVLDRRTGALRPVGTHPRAGHVTALSFAPDGVLYGVDASLARLVTLSTRDGRAILLPPHRVAFITGLAIVRPGPRATAAPGAHNLR